VLASRLLEAIVVSNIYVAVLGIGWSPVSAGPGTATKTKADAKEAAVA